MTFDGTSLGYGSSTFNTLGGSLVDCGTTLTYIPTKVYKDLETRLKASSTYATTAFFNWETCLSSDEVETLPDITITLSYSLSIKFHAAEYLLLYEGCYYWGFSSATYTILGNVIMQNKFVVFDKANNQMGFTDSVSESELSVSQTLPSSSFSLYLTGSVLVAFVGIAVVIQKKRNAEYQSIEMVEI